jgi:hypothetical protein
MSGAAGLSSRSLLLLVLLLDPLYTCSSPLPDVGIADVAAPTALDLPPAADLTALQPPPPAEDRRDWRTSPAIVDSNSTADLYALGDIHGDYARATALLTRVGLLAAAPPSPSAARWTGGSATLVVTGDMVDKWSGSVEVLTLMQTLSLSAPAAGGQVFVLLGNHEVEFFADPHGSKTDELRQSLKAAGIDPDKFAAGKHPLGAWLRTRPIAARVRDWFFSHAGNTAGKTLATLQTEIQTGIDREGFATAALSDADSIVEARLDPTPFWERSGDPAGTLQRYTTALGVSHLVFGHQPSSYTFSDGKSRKKGTLFQQLGKAFLIDAGMSQGVDYSKGGILRVTGSGAATVATALYADGSSKELWRP